MEIEISQELYEKLLKFQEQEITEHIVYRELSKKAQGKNREVLARISKDEKRHYEEWRKYTKREVEPNKFKVFLYLMTAKIFGITFAIKMMENMEKGAEESYSLIVNEIEPADSILKDEVEHERLLIDMIDEERINYIGSMVLGLNDALVELTGALSGLTFALQNTNTIGIAGLITGIAASLSMAASEYLSQKSEGGRTSPLKASVYTGIAYIFTVLFLVFPYFVFSYYMIALAFTLIDAVIVIFLFSFFVSVVKDMRFKSIFFEMFFISFGVAFLSFVIGIIVRNVFHIEI